MTNVTIGNAIYFLKSLEVFSNPFPIVAAPLNASKFYYSMFPPLLKLALLLRNAGSSLDASGAMYIASMYNFLSNYLQFSFLCLFLSFFLFSIMPPSCLLSLSIDLRHSLLCFDAINNIKKS
jgi:hypothetical protein